MAEIAKAEGVSLEYLDLVVEALSVGVGIWTVKRVDNGRKPLLIRDSTAFERFDIAVKSSVDPLGQLTLLCVGILRVKELVKELLEEIGGRKVSACAEHNVYPVKLVLREFFFSFEQQISRMLEINAVPLREFLLHLFSYILKCPNCLPDPMVFVA